MLDYLQGEIEAIFRAIHHGELLSANEKEEPFDVWMSFFQKRDFDKNIGDRAERTYITVIGALLEVISGNSPGMVKHPDFKCEAKLIDHFISFNISGLSKSTLKNKFSKAKKKNQFIMI